MQRRTVQLKVAGQNYKVASSASEDELTRLASVVDQKVCEVTPPGRAASPQSVLLAAMALAHEAEEERLRRRQIERQTRDLLRRVLHRIDGVLEAGDGEGALEGAQALRADAVATP